MSASLDLMQYSWHGVSASERGFVVETCVQYQAGYDRGELIAP